MSVNTGLVWAAPVPLSTSPLGGAIKEGLVSGIVGGGLSGIAMYAIGRLVQERNASCIARRFAVLAFAGGLVAGFVNKSIETELGGASHGLSGLAGGISSLMLGRLLYDFKWAGFLIGVVGRAFSVGANALFG